MKKIILSLFVSTVLLSCAEDRTNKNVVLASLKTPISEVEKPEKHPKFDEYWYDGKAELTSYKLSQARYGETHEGHAVLIYVTEEFLPKKQLKADRGSKNNIPVLKLNNTKKFLTGIYPYSLMSSVFAPINTEKRALKTTFSAQEWCGQTYVQLNNRDKFDIEFHSYFETSGDEKISLKKDNLESEIWTTIRIAPDKLPTGKLTMIPAMEFLAMQHRPIKAYDARASLQSEGNLNLYQIEYPQLNRTLTIKYTKEFPYSIEAWEETFTNFMGKKSRSKAEKMKSIKSDYWNKHNVVDIALRKDLGL